MMRELEIKRAVDQCIKCRKCFGHTLENLCPMYQEFGVTPFSPAGVFYTAAGVMNRFVDMSKEMSVVPFSCTACGACSNLCITTSIYFPWEYPSELFQNIRGLFVEAGAIPESVARSLDNFTTTGNAWHLPKSRKTEWEKKCSFDINNFAEKRNEYLLFVGDAAFISGTEHIPFNIAEILYKAGIDFGTLKGKEEDSGNEARVMGELGLFEEIALNNIELFEKYSVKNIITISPHDYVAFRYEYPKLGFKAEGLYHYTEIISELIEQGKIKLANELSGRVTYQDPCHLGRYLGVYDAPREILRAIPSIDFVEMPLNKKQAFCCGGGGGRMWYEPDDHCEKRISDTRLEHARQAGADIVATACPYCMNMFQEAMNLGELVIKDISELALEAME